MDRSDEEHRRGRVLVPDTSVLINLLATPFADRVIASVGSEWVYTELVHRELIVPAAYGASNEAGLEQLLERGLVRIVQMSRNTENLAISLMSGSTTESLGGGEATTIAYAGSCVDAEAIIDDRKACRLGLERFPRLRVSTTMSILREPAVEACLGRELLAAGVEAALRDARAAVARADFPWILQLIGRERLADCASVARWI